MTRAAELDMSTEPSEFREALDEFTARRVVSRKEADELSDYARKRVWWISGVAQMDVVNDVRESIRKAISEGTPYEEWKKEVAPKLEKAWGRPNSARILTIFRNATTSAYNAGRLEQMEQPHIVAVRPYKMLDVVDDLRTTDLCHAFIDPPVVLPWDDTYWLTHSPPFHHRCRTGIRSLRRSVAEREGIMTQAPTDTIDDGWGIDPRLAEPPKPSERETPPDPELQFENAVKGGKYLRESKPVAVTKRKELTPEYWEEHYREKYGDAAKQVAHGRLVHEMSKEMSDDEAVEILNGLRAKKVPGLLLTNGADVDNLLAQMSKMSGRNDLSDITGPPELTEQIDEARRWFSAFASRDLNVPRIKWNAIGPNERAYYSIGEDELFIPSGGGGWTAVHELTHAVERHSGLGKKVAKFKAAREDESEFQLLSDIFPGRSYGEKEIAVADKYWNAYMGKYTGTDETHEVLSILFEDIYDGNLRQMLEKDPESVYFAIGILHGM